MMKVFLTAIVFFFSWEYSFGQRIDLVNFNYQKADSIALHFDRKNITAENLAMYLTEDLDSEHEKFRVLFRWVTENISYSFAQNSSDPEATLKERKGVCSSYSYLLRELCIHNNIDCIVVTGYSKVIESRDIGPKTKTDHAWNAVKLYDQWYLVDATWAAGYINGRTFTKHFDPFYYLPDPDVFKYRHLPANQKWMLTDETFTLKEFGFMPIYHDRYFEQGLTDVEKPEGIIKDKLKYKFKSVEPVRKVSYYLDTERKFQPIDYVKIDDHYEINIKFESYKKGELLLYIDGACVLGFLKK